MNRAGLGLTIVAAIAACSPLQAVAAPTAYYNPATGGIHLKNDTGAKLGAIGVISESLLHVAKTDPSLYASIPGATFDAGDLPYGFTYLSYPSTGSEPFGFFIGNVIVPGTPASDLSGLYYPWLVATSTPVAIVEVPEPSSIVVATIGATLLLRRRQRRQPN